MSEPTQYPVMAKQYAELANVIRLQADVIANDAVQGSKYAAVTRLLRNAETLMAWTPDDRQTHSTPRKDTDA